MPGIRNVEDLIIWQKAMDLCQTVYEITVHFPKYEIYGLASQMRRASISMPSNIAEGFGRKSRSEFKQFLSIALGSACELKTQLIIAKRIGYISENEAMTIIESCEVLSKQIGKFLLGVR